MNESEVEHCNACGVELETAHNGDTESGDVLLSTTVTYCPKCLEIYDSDVSISRA